MTELMYTNGIDLQTGYPLWAEVPFEDFLRSFLTGLGLPPAGARISRRDSTPLSTSESSRQSTLQSTRALTTSSNLFKAVTPNLNDPVQAGYGVIIPPGRAVLLDGPLAPLLHLHRVKPEDRLIFDAQRDIVTDWINDHITYRDSPYYWLLVGGPAELPFELQWLLDAGKATGRIEFATESEYAAYADRVVRAEQALVAAQEPPQVFFWAPQPDTPTRISKWYMCDPLVESVRGRGLSVEYRQGAEATVGAFWTKGETWGQRPGLIFTAGHGGALPRDDPRQTQMQGCLLAPDGTITGEGATKMPEAFPRSVLFNFACYSGGTPSHSDFGHWIPQFKVDKYTADTPFISHLYRELLAHRAGPLICIGHLEPTWIHSFLDPTHPDEVFRDPALDAEWGERMQPFRTFVNRIVQGYTVGHAMEMFGFLYNDLGNDLARRINRHLREAQPPSQLDQEIRRMVTRWISFSNYQNYVVFGDPAVRIA